ncbi:MAG TPA: response regulator [Terriglobales bacterium]|nr:response regulator [Terriglobales bacterium]
MASRSPQLTDAPHSSEPTKCLLCVDDHEEVLSIMGEFLRVFGYSVLTAPSGARGLQLLQRNPVDAVILDYEMPKMDGAELALRIKADRPELPVLMFTGYPADVPQEVRRSVNAFVVKGDPAEKLLQTLRDLLPVRGEPSPRKAPAKGVAGHNTPRRRGASAARRNVRRRA